MPASKSHYLLLLAFIIVTSALSGVPRADFYWLMAGVSLSFVLYWNSFNIIKTWGLGLGIFFVVIVRVAFFFELPLLSEDFYRFLWDGMLLNEGFTSIGNIPNEFDVSGLSNPELAQELLTNMNSAQYPSIYPPFHQWISGFAFFFGGESVLSGVNGLRFVFLLVEIGFLAYVALFATSMTRYALFYLMNPLVIVEGFGNVHIEAMLVPILGIALVAMIRRKPVESAVAWISTVLIKFYTLVLAPMLFFRFSSQQRWIFVGAATGMTILVLAISQPFGTIEAFADGMGIYYGLFEFNASVYYVLSAILTAIIGYNPVAQLAPALAVAVFLTVLAVSYFKRGAGIMELALVVFLIYLFGTTTVHPWYIMPVILCATFANRYYILIWSVLAFLSYSHYLGDLGPKWTFIVIEYVGLIAAIVLEGRREKWLQPVFRG